MMTTKKQYIKWLESELLATGKYFRPFGKESFRIVKYPPCPKCKPPPPKPPKDRVIREGAAPPLNNNYVLKDIINTVRSGGFTTDEALDAIKSYYGNS